MMENKLDELLVLLEQVQDKKDYESVAASYLELGTAYREEGRIAKAIYFLKRFDNLVGGDDSLYEKFAEEDNQAMNWITDLEMEQEPYEKNIQNQVLEKAENLNQLQKMQWLLLTMSRFCTLFRHISILPDFKEFGRLEEIVDLFSAGLFGELDEDAEEEISDYYDIIDEVFDSSLMSDYTQKVEIPHQKSFVPADLESGDIGTYFFSMACGALQSFLFDDLEDDDINMEFAACGILADYYYRTTDAAIEKEQKIQEETERIFSDYDFIQTVPSQKSFQQRIETYKNIMLV